MSDELTKVSKFLSYVLRHKPDAIELWLDPEGWALVDELIDNADIAITRELLDEAVATNDKKRCALDAQSRR